MSNKQSGNATKLNDRQDNFCIHYVELNNGEKAAIKAGYSPKSARSMASELLTKPNIQNRINELLEKMKSKKIADATEVMEYLTSVLRGDVKEEVVVVEAIGDYCSKANTVKKEVSPKDRNKAAELLAKRYGLLTDKVNVSGSMVVFVKDDIPDDDE